MDTDSGPLKRPYSALEAHADSHDDQPQEINQQPTAEQDGQVGG